MKSCEKISTLLINAMRLGRVEGYAPLRQEGSIAVDDYAEQRAPAT